jgi:hypothetical protein
MIRQQQCLRWHPIRGTYQQLRAQLCAVSEADAGRVYCLLRPRQFQFDLTAECLDLSIVQDLSCQLLVLLLVVLLVLQPVWVLGLCLTLPHTATSTPQLPVPRPAHLVHLLSHTLIICQ